MMSAMKKSKSYAGGVASASINGDIAETAKLKNKLEVEANPEMVTEEEEVVMPKLPKGKRVLDTTVGTDVDSLYRSVFANDDFFEILSSKVYDELRSFSITPWSAVTSVSGPSERTIRYEFTKYIAFSRQVVQLQQKQVLAPYSRPGAVYAVDTVSRNSGIVYSDYFVIHIHYRMTRDEGDAYRTRVEVIVNIEFLKPCLFRGRIESEAWGGLKKYYEIMEKEIQTERDIRRRTEQQEQQLPKLQTEEEEDNDDDRGIADLEHNTTTGGDEVATAVRGKSAGKSSKQGKRRKELKTEDWARGANPQNQVWTSAWQPVACALVVATLFLLTVAMFKMNSTLVLMEARLNQLESLANSLRRDRGEFKPPPFTPPHGEL